MKNRKFKLTGKLLTKEELVIAKGNANKASKALKEINGVVCAERPNLSEHGHAAYKRNFNKTMSDTQYVGIGIILKAYKHEEYGFYVKGEAFNTIVSNSPLTRELAKANGDLNKIGCPTLDLKHWDKDEKKLINDYSVVINDRTSNKSGTKFTETKAVCIVDFSTLESSLKPLCSSEEEIKEVKEKLIDEIFTCGLDIRKDGSVHCTAMPQGTVYNIISWSPSNERSETAMLTSLPIAKAYSIINKLSGGTISSAIEKQRTIAKLMKFAKRIGILSAPAMKTVGFGNDNFGCIIVNGTIEGPEDYDEENKAILKKAGIKIDRNTYDGSVIYSAKFIKAMFEAMGIKMSEKQALLFALQTRCSGLLSKVFGEGKSDMNIKFRKDILISNTDANRILRVKAGENVGNKERKDYDLIIVGNEDNIGVIIDENGAKALKDISLQDIANGDFINYVLDIAQCSITKSAGQMLQKFIVADKDETLKSVFHLISDEFGDRLDEYLKGDLDVSTCSLARFILRHVDNGAENSEALKSVIQTELLQLESQMKNYRMKLNAVYLRALFDDAYFLTKGKIDGVLGVSKYTGKLEAYSYDVELRFKDEIDAIYADDSIADKEKALDELLTGVVFKYPSPSSDEVVNMTFKTSKVLVERIANMNQLTKQQREVLIDDFVNTSYGVIKMAPNNTIKHRLAGMDTDYDGVAVVFEKSLVNIILKATEKQGHDGITVIKSV